jgi:hypothetical protein
MNDLENNRTPAAFDAILSDTNAFGFQPWSRNRKWERFWPFSRHRKPGGRFLELGTGTGHGTAWLLSGMDSTSTNNPFGNCEK